jgi:hypothetical protein
MKHILDSSFRYKPSFDTDVRKTFERVRRQQQTKVREQKTEGEARANNGQVRVKVLQLDQLKKANGS